MDKFFGTWYSVYRVWMDMTERIVLHIRRKLMTNAELLQTMSDLLDEKLDAKLDEKLQPMRDDMQSMKVEIQGVKDEIQGVKDEIQGVKDEMQGMKDDMQDMKVEMQGMKDEIQGVKNEMQGMKGEMQGMKTDIHELQRKVAEIGMHIENCTDNNVQLLAENFIELTNKLNMAVPAAHNNYMYEIKVNYLWKEVDKIKQIIKEKLV